MLIFTLKNGTDLFLLPERKAENQTRASMIAVRFAATANRDRNAAPDHAGLRCSVTR